MNGPNTIERGRRKSEGEQERKRVNVVRKGGGGLRSVTKSEAYDEGRENKASNSSKGKRRRGS